MSRIHTVLFLSLTGALALPVLSQPSRIRGQIAGGQRVALQNNVHPKARPQNDQGLVDPALNLPAITLILQPSASQKTALDQLLAQQQDPTSANYHQWLTPEQYADRFGASQSDVNQIVTWLQNQKLSVTGVARGRNWIMVSGTAAAVGAAFGTSIHHYLVNGEVHYANATEPLIPAALQGIVAAIHGLNDFRLKPASRPRGVTPGGAQPQYTNNTTCNVHCLAPDDLATIYNIKSLYGNGFDGTGQKIVVVGQTQIRLTDIDAYRSTFGLAAKDPQVVLVPGQPDPGISTTGDLSEADLDLEIAGAVGRNANIIYVYSGDVTVSEQYAIDQNLAPVMSSSYGDCEPAIGAPTVLAMETWAKQANAQGMTWFGASGDAGATDCNGDGANMDNVVSVDVPASLPEVTGVGGTEFNDGSGNYWSPTNSSTLASALSYIPETAWNDTAIDGAPSASGGGASAIFAKPSWQTGAGVPKDNARDVPDISISASADHDGYVIFTSDAMACGSGRRTVTQCEVVFGGTSIGAPAFAGLAAVLNQSVIARGLQQSAGLGNINPMLYSLAQTAPAAFHDVTTGNNDITVTCPRGQVNCTPGTVGFNAGVGYDQVTGLGSIDAGALSTAWVTSGGPHTTTPPPSITAFGNGASYNQIYAPGMILTIYGSNLSPVTASASSVPLPPAMSGVTVTINGVAAPIWYVSPGQLNVQVPYETPLNTAVQLTVNNNGQSAASSFVAAIAAPGIFTDAQGEPLPNTSAALGQVVTMYVTGVGAVTPGIASGAAPPGGTPLNSLPVPQQKVIVTVGGVNAPISFAGIPWGLVGIMQVNYQIPTGMALGPQPVVVTVGTTASKAATLTVTQ
jgi:uncharacterized protein (TIGR03437 family)